MQNNDVTFKHINAQQVAEALDSENYVIVDIRDVNAFNNSHIPGAVHLTNDNLTDFLHQADYDVPTVVCCYHGISSQQAAQFLISQDFTDVYSLDGGFEQWAMLYPDKIER